MNLLRAASKLSAINSPRLSQSYLAANPIRGVYFTLNYCSHDNVVREQQLAAARKAPRGKFSNVKQVMEKNSKNKWDTLPFNKVDLRGGKLIHTQAISNNRGKVPSPQCLVY